MQADCPAYRYAAGQFRAVRLKAFWALARLLKQPPAQDARAIPFAGLKRRDLSQYYFQLQIRSRATAIDAPRAAAGLSESGRPHSRAPSTAMQRASALRPPPQMVRMRMCKYSVISRIQRLLIQWILLSQVEQFEIIFRQRHPDQPLEPFLQ